MNKVVVVLVFILAFPVMAQEKIETYIVHLRSSMRPTLLRDIEITRPTTSLKKLSIEILDMTDAEAKNLRRAPGVVAVEKDLPVKALGIVTTLEAPTAELNRIGVPTVWKLSEGEGIDVAVLDSGIDYTHADLKDRYKGGYDFVNNDSDPMDDNRHGTHVAGTIAASQNGQGAVGVAPKANLWGLKVLDDKGDGKFSAVLKALSWCLEREKRMVVNLSLGTVDYPGASIERSFQRARDQGLLIIGSSGNKEDEPVGYPAAFSSVISVGASNSEGKRATFSSFGPNLQVIAPGVRIYSSLPTALYLSGFGYMSGTSMASPHVAGLAALLMAYRPDASLELISLAIMSGTNDVDPKGWDPESGYGEINAVKAFEVLEKGFPPKRRAVSR